MQFRLTSFKCSWFGFEMPPGDDRDDFSDRLISQGKVEYRPLFVDRLVGSVGFFGVGEILEIWNPGDLKAGVSGLNCSSVTHHGRFVVDRGHVADDSAHITYLCPLECGAEDAFDDLSSGG